MIRFFILLFLLVFHMGLAQEVNFPLGFKFPPSSIGVHDYGLSNLNIYYKVSFSINPKNLDSKKEAITVLQIGDKVSKFIDIYDLKKDSLSLATKGQEVNSEMFNAKVKYNSIWKKAILKDFLASVYTIQSTDFGFYRYKEKQLLFSWVLGNEEKDVLGYTCQKATMNYSGRHYTAWFTKDIPISNGPYIFGGLPGLILEIYDEKYAFHFTSVGINQKSNPIFLRSDKQVKEISKEKFKTLEKSYHDNPGFFINGKAYGEDGVEISPRLPALAYYPLELE